MQAVIDRLLERKRAKREEEAARGGSGGGMAGQVELGHQPGQQQRQRRQGQGEGGLTELSFEELVALAQPTDLGERCGALRRRRWRGAAVWVWARAKRAKRASSAELGQGSTGARLAPRRGMQPARACRLCALLVQPVACTT